MASVAETNAQGIRESLGPRYRKAQAEEVLSTTWRHIVGEAKRALADLESNPKRREAVWETVGVQFRFAGHWVWMAKRGHKIVCRIKDLV